MKRNIMVVDDDDDTLNSLKNIFEHKGHDVVTVSDGIACIEKLENGFKGIILMDLMMPKMDGWDTIREIVRRGLEKNVDILVITAIGTFQHEKMKGLETYIQDYVAKPFDVDKIVKTIELIN